MHRNNTNMLQTLSHNFFLYLLYNKPIITFCKSVSGRRDSNPQLSVWKTDALPIELLPQKITFIGILFCYPDLAMSIKQRLPK